MGGVACFFVPPVLFSLCSCPVHGTIKVGKGFVFLFILLCGGSVVSASSSSLASLGGCARCAGASLGRLSVSRSGFGRLAFVFPSASWAARFASVLGGWSWVSLVASVRCRGRVVVVGLWGVFPPAAPPAVHLAGPASPRPSWCGSAPAFASVPVWGAVSVGRWSPVGFFLRGLGFQQSSLGSCWQLPAGASSPVRRLAAASAGVRLFGFVSGPCRPFLADCPWSSWGLVLLCRA